LWESGVGINLDVLSLLLFPEQVIVEGNAGLGVKNLNFREYVTKILTLFYKSLMAKP
jgi:hypothetical protein